MTSQRIILVTGGGGFLGSAVVRMLVAGGEAVRTFSRSSYPHLSRIGVEQIQGDLADIQGLVKACRNVEAVFHVAAKPGIWGSYQSFYAPNVVGTRNVIEACRRNGVQRLIYTSSPSVIFDGKDMQGIDESVPYPETFHAHYPRTKALAEQAVLDAARNGLPAVALRPHLIWGPGDNHLVPRILARAGRLRRVGGGTNLVDTIYIDNAAHAHLLAEAALKDNPAISATAYFISQDCPIALWEMIDLILAAGGKPPVKKTISPAAAFLVGAVCEGLYKFFQIKKEPPMTRFVARELATSHWFNIAAAKRDLGYKPLVSTQEGLRRLAAWIERR
ncbi:MAG: NAD-dependent epimerase/dehydratase family protein [Desulfobacteraceae bacterium]|jgi:nucleoside-diphosphate-sugar epimerase